MTEMDHSLEPGRFLGDVVSERVKVLTQLADGQYEDALTIGRALLLQIDQWLDSQRGQWAIQPRDSIAANNLLLLTQRVGLITDCALAAVGEGDEESAEFFLSGLGGTNLREVDYPYRSAIVNDLVFRIGTTMCVHGRPTLDPGGRCLKKPPCP